MSVEAGKGLIRWAVGVFLAGLVTGCGLFVLGVAQQSAAAVAGVGELATKGAVLEERVEANGKAYSEGLERIEKRIDGFETRERQRDEVLRDILREIRAERGR